MSAPQLQTLQLGSLRMQVATQGSCPLVVMCHGFPELWCSWREQMAALAAAGWRVAAPDMRGYGGTDAPADPARYTMLHHVGDLVALVHALGETSAVVVGHDWGAPAAWSAALVRPDIFRAVVGLSVPYTPPSPVDLLSALRAMGVDNFYTQYFQTPGVAEAELQADVAATLRRVTYSLSGDGTGGVATVLAPGTGFLLNTQDPADLAKPMPAWVSQSDLAHATAEFTRTGLRGGMNWYRSLRHSWEVMTPWRGLPMKQPSMFIGGDRDDVLKFPTSAASIKRFEHTLPGLRGCHILPGVGHWVPRERAAEVNRLLLEFLAGL